MNCLVCGKKLGLLAHFKRQSNTVCDPCSEQATQRLQVLIRTVASNQSWKRQFAEGWIEQFESTVQKYQLHSVEELRTSLLIAIFQLVGALDYIEEDDLAFLLKIAERYRLAQSKQPEIMAVIQRIVLRKTIQEWQEGKTPKLQCLCAVPLKEEICHWEEPAGLLIQRKKREYVGGYGSVSVPIPLLQGVRARVGGFRGVPVDHTLHDDGGSGVLHITNQRILFAGREQSIAVSYHKIVDIGLYANGLEIHTSAVRNLGIFLVSQPDLLKEVITLASSTEDSGSKRRKHVQPTP